MAKMFRFLIAMHFLAVASLSFAQVVPDERTLQYLNSEPHKKLIMMIGITFTIKTSSTEKKFAKPGTSGIL